MEGSTYVNYLCEDCEHRFPIRRVTHNAYERGDAKLKCPRCLSAAVRRDWQVVAIKFNGDGFTKSGRV